MELPFIVLIVILLPIVIRGYYLLLKKTEFELKGFELALYERNEVAWLKTKKCLNFRLRFYPQL